MKKENQNQKQNQNQLKSQAKLQRTKGKIQDKSVKSLKVTSMNGRPRVNRVSSTDHIGAHETIDNSNTIKDENEIERQKNYQKRTENSREENNKKVDKNRELIHITFVFVGLFMLMAGYFIYFVAYESKEVINNPYNKRQDLLAEQVIRGDIISSDGKVLAYTKVGEDKSEKRIYPYNNLFANVVGRVSRGRTGIELTENFLLLTSNDYGIRQILTELKGEKNPGDSVITTLDTQLQQIASDGLGSNNGSVVVMEPSSGKVLAMVSKPNYDPNKISEQWNELLENSNSGSPLINRATQGLYPPGSIYKILTLLEYMREHKDHELYEYECTGSAIFNGVVINCYNNKAHGVVNLEESFAKSCNTSFAYMGTKINMDKFRDLNETFMFNKDLPTAFTASTSSFALNSKSDNGDIPQTVIGQGKTLMTPLHAAMITSAIANGGIVMKPYVVDRVESVNETTVKKYFPQLYDSILTTEEAEILTRYMESVVNDGTASALNGKEYEVAGKTGSAEFEQGKPAHAWFVGFAPADNPEIVVSVVVEGVGTGSQYAVPIASQIFDNYFKNR